MTFLDVFSIGFKSDNLKQFETELKKNEKELEKYDNKVKECETALKELEEQGKKDTEEYKKLSDTLTDSQAKVTAYTASIQKMKSQSEYGLLKLKDTFAKLTKTAAKFVAVGTAVKKSMQFYEEAEQLDFLAQKTGIAVEKLQELGNAAQSYGGTTEGTAGTIETLREHYTSIKKGTASEEITKYKTVFTDNPEQTLENIAKKMETMKSETEKWDFANSIGIDEGTTRLLVQGTAKYREELKRTAKYKLYTKEDIERMKDYQQIQTDIRMGIQKIWATIARLLLPSLTVVAKAIRAVTDWMAEHEGAVKIAAVFAILASSIGGVTLAIKLLRGAITVLKANHVVLIIIAVIALITALIAIVQDFITFVQGGNSVIGEILEKMGFNVEEIRQKCINFFDAVKEGIKSAIEWFKNLGGKIKDFGDKLKELWDNLPDPIKKLIGLSNGFTAGFTMVNIAKEGIQKYNENKLNALPQGTISNTSQTTAINNNNKSIQQISRQSKTQTVNIDKINIQTQAADAQAIARDMKNAVNYFDDGMAL